jgi:TFIIF-interacting CTD phosphatase-like protein
MTQAKTEKIKCQCGNVVDVTLLDSVNVTLDPNLKNLIMERKINNFYCLNCGAKNELIKQFLYNDMDKKKQIWCYSENRKQDAEQIEKMLDEVGVQFEKASGQKYIKPSLVFGYDELFKLI